MIKIEKCKKDVNKINGSDIQYRRLTNTFHLTLKMTSAQVVETSVTNKTSFQNYPHPDDYTIRTNDTPGFKTFTKINKRRNHCQFWDSFSVTLH